MSLTKTNQNIFSKAINAHEDGRLKEAESLYRTILETTPAHPETCNYLALLLHSKGESKTALSFLEISLEAKPDDLDAQGNRAAILESLGEKDAAILQYRSALENSPGNCDIALDLCRLLEAEGDLDAALAVAMSTREENPNDNQLQLETARLLQENGRGADAVTIMQNLIQKFPDNVDLKLQLGQLLQDLYRMDEAADQYHFAIKCEKTNALAHYKLGRCLAEKGDWSDAVAMYRKALALRPEQPEILLYLSRALNEVGEREEAIITCHRAYAAQPDYRGRDITLGILLLEAERYEEAAAEFHNAVEYHPTSVSVAALAQCLLAQGHPLAARKISDEHLKNSPGDTHVLVIHSLILEALQDKKEVRRIVDFKNLLQQTYVDPPETFKTADDFNSALAEHILAHPSLTLSPPRNATRDGYHSGELFEEPMGPFSYFHTILETAVTEYMAKMPTDPSHPFILGAPKDWWLNAWAVVLDGPGRQISHAHNTAWLSGVYYVQLPTVINSGKDKEGWIEFGTPPPDFPVHLNPETFFIKPEVGKLVLFPGYMFHQTIPTEVSERRISVAFNVIPELE